MQGSGHLKEDVGYLVQGFRLLEGSMVHLVHGNIVGAYYKICVKGKENVVKCLQHHVKC